MGTGWFWVLGDKGLYGNGKIVTRLSPKEIEMVLPFCNVYIPRKWCPLAWEKFLEKWNACAEDESNEAD